MLEIVNHILVYIASMPSITYIQPEVTFVTNYKYQNVNFMPNNMGTTYLLIQRNILLSDTGNGFIHRKLIGEKKRK